MSDRDLTVRLGRRTLGRRAVSLLGVTAALVLIGGGGSLLGAESATTSANRTALAGPDDERLHRFEGRRQP